MMDFKRSLWGYSAEQVIQHLNARSLAFQTKRQEYERGLEIIQESEKELEQLLNQLQNQYNQIRQRQHVIESARPILDIFLSLCQDYVASQAEIVERSNETHLAEINLQTEQIKADQNKIMLFWKTLHENLGNILNAVELVEATGKSLLSKYTSDLENRSINLDNDSSQPINYNPLPDNDKRKVVQSRPQNDMAGFEPTGYNPLPDDNKRIIIQPKPRNAITVSETDGHEPQQDDDKWKVAQSETKADMAGFVKIENEPRPVNDKWRVAQPESQADTDIFCATMPAFDAFKATRLETAPALDNNCRVDDDNTSISIDIINKIIEPEQHPLPTMKTGSKRQALILDDDATILAMLRIILERDGFSIIECTDGYQARQNINMIDPPLLAILDTNSPIVNGLELVCKIRSNPEWNYCSIIMLTENPSEQEIMNLLEAGANDCINKPVNTRDLVFRIRSLTGITEAAL